MKKNPTSKWKRNILLVVGALLVLLLILLRSGWGEIFLWQFDLIRGWELRVQTEIPPYSVELVQEPGMDFYNSYLLIKREDGNTAFILMDGDDSKWRNPQVIQKEGKTYFVRGSGQIGDRTPFIDPINNIVFSGYLQRTYKITELEFKNEQNQHMDFTVKPPVD